MATFAERMGARPIRSVMQVDEIDAETRTALWNTVYELHTAFDREERFWLVQQDQKVASQVWRNHYLQPLDAFNSAGAWTRIRLSIMDGDLIDCLGTLEAFVQSLNVSAQFPGLPVVAREEFNKTFAANLVGFRFIDLELVKVGTNEEANSISQAITATRALGGAQQSLKAAVTLLSNREHPNFAKSLAESIHAVEAIVRDMTGSGTLGEGLQRLEARGFKMHPALKSSWLKMYGYASDEHGVRHGSIESNDVDEKLATYFLVTCSAFVNLLLKFEASP